MRLSPSFIRAVTTVRKGITGFSTALKRCNCAS